MIKGIYCLFASILFSIGMAASSAPQGWQDLGKISIPKDFEIDTEEDSDVLPPGDYTISLYGNQLGLAYRDKKSGFEIGYRIPSETEKTKEDPRPPKVDVSLIQVDGTDHVRISVFSGTQMYTSLLRCASNGKPKSLSAESRATLDPQIISELDVLKQSLELLDKFSGTIWPNWTGYNSLEFSITFPNRTKLVFTNKERLPANYRQMDITMPGGKKVFINRSREIPGRIGSITNLTGHGGAGGVSLAIRGLMDSLNGSAPTALGGPSQSSNLQSRKMADDAARFERMMLYVHEAFHGMQNLRILTAETKGLGRNRGIPDRNYSPTLDFSLYSEIEGEALIKALNESSDDKSLGYFKDFLVAREVKLKELPAGAAYFDSINTMIEGTATYSAIKMALLIQGAGLDKKSAGEPGPIPAALTRTGDYLEKEMKNAINRLKGDTFDVIRKHYIYGAYWCLLLDRFYPSWKQGLFEGFRSLDDVTADFVKMPEAEKAAIRDRLQKDFEFEKIKARHALVVQARDEAIASISNRKGKIYIIDVKHAQSGFNINPRQFILHNGVQIYPRGLVELVFGSLRLKSEETPMRLIISERLLEWIDTDAKPGEKGYDLKYRAQEGDLYKHVTVTTKGFSMTAGAVKIADDGDTVKISIWD